MTKSNPAAQSLRQRVFGACDQLLRSGKTEREITNAVVREALGSGSYTHLSPHLREWRERRQAAAIAAIAAPEPPREFEELWPTVWRMASNAHDAARRVWDDERGRLQADAQEHLAEIGRLEEVQADLGERFRTEREDLERRLREMRGAKSAAEERTAELQASLASAEAARARAEGERDSLKEALDALRQSFEVMQRADRETKSPSR